MIMTGRSRRKLLREQAILFIAVEADPVVKLTSSSMYESKISAYR
jgi:hypothetical protein